MYEQFGFYFDNYKDGKSGKICGYIQKFNVMGIFTVGCYAQNWITIITAL